MAPLVAPLVVALLPLLPRVLLVLAVLAAVSVPGEVDRLTKLLRHIRVLSLAALLAPVLVLLVLHRLRVLRRNLPLVAPEEVQHSVRELRVSSDLCCVVQLVVEGPLLSEQLVEADRWDPKCVGCPALEDLARKPGM